MGLSGNRLVTWMPDYRFEPPLSYSSMGIRGGATDWLVQDANTFLIASRYAIPFTVSGSR